VCICTQAEKLPDQELSSRKITRLFFTTALTILSVLFSVVLAAVSLTQISPFITAFSNGIGAAHSLFNAMDRVSAIDPMDEGGKKPQDVAGDISFTNVSFSYPTRPDVQVLKNFSLVVPAKKTTALVGSSGSGKSTCVGLLERWYNPATGTIAIDGQSIDGFNLHWLRTRMRLVQQEPVLFNGTVFENVSFGLIGSQWEHASADIRMEQVVAACKIANADAFVSALPEGYNTHVGERAGLLSGGQKQRIAIARAVVSDPEILLLDEATSALDPHSEGEVQKALDRASINRTTIVIAHKLATIMNADNIVVMSQGEIVEQGTHQQLLSQGGSYARLVEAQGLEADIEKPNPDEEEIEVLLEDKGDMTGIRKILSRTKTQQSVNVPDVTYAAQQNRLDYDNHKHHGILWVLGTTIRDQREMWPLFAIIFITCLAGGKCLNLQKPNISHILITMQLPYIRYRPSSWPGSPMSSITRAKSSYRKATSTHSCFSSSP
jgi:ATP-binding cassette subfamily B (MDR/TAP) protein 1